MPWVYELELAEWRTADEVKTLWSAAGLTTVSHDDGGVNVVSTPSGVVATVSTTPRSPDYETLVEAAEVVEDVVEVQEIPAKDNRDEAVYLDREDRVRLHPE